MKRLATLGLALLLGLSSLPARAGVVFLPRSRHQQLLSFALLTEEQCGLLIRNEKRTLVSVGGALTLFEYEEGLAPQLTFFTDVHMSLIQKSWPGGFTAETFDGRIGIAVESTISEGIHVGFGLIHASGHAADGTLDPDLLAPNLGDDSLYLRGIADVGDFRFGATLRPALDSDPSTVGFAADQFFEWFPLGEKGTPRTMHPFFALGFEENGVDKLRPSYNVQLGVFAGNHRKPNPLPTVRFVVGYYHGADPRLKYARLRNNRVSFPYLGALLNL